MQGDGHMRGSDPGEVSVRTLSGVVPRGLSLVPGWDEAFLCAGSDTGIPIIFCSQSNVKEHHDGF